MPIRYNRTLSPNRIFQTIGTGKVARMTSVDMLHTTDNTAVSMLSRLWQTKIKSDPTCVRNCELDIETDIKALGAETWIPEPSQRTTVDNV